MFSNPPSLLNSLLYVFQDQRFKNHIYYLECKNRIEQYEARLLHMNQEIDLHKEAAEEKTKELEELRVLSTTLGQERQQTSEESKRKVDETEHKFAKLKGAYQQIREDHIKVCRLIFGFYRFGILAFGVKASCRFSDNFFNDFLVCRRTRTYIRRDIVSGKPFSSLEHQFWISFPFPVRSFRFFPD